MTNPTDLTKQPDDSSSSPQTPSGSINVNPTLTNQLISINASAQAPIKLTPFNYQIWYTQWYSLLIGYDFLNFVEQDRKTEATGNSFLFRQDQFIRSALIASLSPEVAPFVVGDKTSYDVWQSLSKMYAKPSQSRIMSLREQLLTITKGSLTISEYLQKAKSISFQLETAVFLFLQLNLLCLFFLAFRLITKKSLRLCEQEIMLSLLMNFMRSSQMWRLS